MAGLNLPTFQSQIGVGMVDPNQAFTDSFKNSMAVQDAVRTNVLRSALSPVLSDPTIPLAQKTEMARNITAKHDALKAYDLMAAQQKEEQTLKKDMLFKKVDTVMKTIQPALESGNPEAISWANNYLSVTQQNDPELRNVLDLGVNGGQIPSQFKVSGSDYTIESGKNNKLWRINKLENTTEPVMADGKQLEGQPKSGININMGAKDSPEQTQANLAQKENTFPVSQTDYEAMEVKGNPVRVPTSVPGKSIYKYVGLSDAEDKANSTVVNTVTLFNSVAPNFKADAVAGFPGVESINQFIKSPKWQAQAQILANANAEYQKEFFGTALTKTEAERLKKGQPNPFDTPEAFWTKLQMAKRSGYERQQKIYSKYLLRGGDPGRFELLPDYTSVTELQAAMKRGEVKYGYYVKLNGSVTQVTKPKEGNK